MSGSITVPGSASTPTLSFVGSSNVGLAQQIAASLAAAATSGLLEVINYTGGSTIPTETPGTTEELAYSPTVPGSITIPAAASGVNEVLVVDNTAPVTIHGNPSVSILGGTNVTIIDPNFVGLGGIVTTTAADAVTITAANSGSTISMGYGNESVVALSSADTIFGGSDTAGNFYLQDAGTDDVIVTGFGNASVTAAGSGAVVFGNTGPVYVDAAGGAGNTVDFGVGGGTFLSSSASSADTIFAGVASVTVNAGNSFNDVIIGDTGALAVNAASASNLLVFGPISGPGMDFVGGSGSATVVGQAGSDTISGGSGSLEIVTGPNETLAASGRSVGTILFGNVNTDVIFTGSTGSLLYAADLGNETINASGSGSNNVFWGGPDSAGSNLIVGGSGNDLLAAGSGTDTLTGGAGTNEFAFLATILGSAAHTDVITDFLTGSNNVALVGTVPGSLDSVSAASSAGSTTVTLNDGTKIEFLGVSSASMLSGHIFNQ
jgi:Ca2+-binding RTX toxin-like protein